MRHPAGSICLVILLSAFPGAQQIQTPATSPPARHPANVPALAAGGITDGVYRNPHFGFSYKVPFGWVDRTAEMQESDSDQTTSDPAKAQVLLGVFERPPETTGTTINSTIVIAAESVSSYPGLKTAVDYFDPLEEVIKAKGFKVENQPYEFAVGANLLAREDFSKVLDKLTIQQATLVMLAKGYAVSFTFIGSTSDEIDELLEGLSFTAAPRSGNGHSASSPASPHAAPKK